MSRSILVSTVEIVPHTDQGQQTTVGVILGPRQTTRF